MSSEIIQVKKKGGLQSIKTDHGYIKPVIFQQDSKDRNTDGEPMGEYKGGQLPTGKYFLAPTWNRLKRQWSWGGTTQDLKTCIKGMRLRYERGHDQKGQLIDVSKESDGDLKSRISHLGDVVFNHTSLYGREFISGGATTLNLEDPYIKFLHFCMLGDHTVDRRGITKSKYVQAGTKLELVSIKEENIAKATDADLEVEAIMRLGAMKRDENKMRAVAEIMDLRNVNSATDINGLFILLKDLACQNTATKQAYNGKTHQQRFIEVTDMPDEELAIARRVMQAKKRGYIRQFSDHASFKGEKLEGIKNELQLMEFFKDPINNDIYIKLIDLFENA